MNRNKTASRGFYLCLSAGFAALIGFSVLTATPALADHKHNKWKHHEKYAKHGHGKKHGHGPDWYGYYRPDHGPRVIYVEEPRYYVVPAPRYQQAPVVYSRPSINIVVPIFD